MLKVNQKAEANQRKVERSQEDQILLKQRKKENP